MVRLISNYSRLILTFAFGIITVRLMAEIGSDAALIYLLLISSTGIAAMFKFALQNAQVPALGLTVDGKSSHDFTEVFWTSFLFGCFAAILSLAMFSVFWLFSDELNLGALSAQTISIAILSTAIKAFASSIGMVFLNLLMIEHRMVTYNILLVLERGLVLLPALFVFYLPDGISIDEKLQYFYLIAAGLTVLLQIVTWWLSGRTRTDFRLRRVPMRKETSRWIAKFIGWNAAVIVASTMFTRWPPLVVNYSMGERLTLTISIVMTLIGYQRQISMGLVVGLDAQFSRFFGSGEQSAEASARALILRSTYLLTAFSAFSVLVISLFVEPILQLWFGQSLADSGWRLEDSAQLFRIMSIGIAASIVTEGWMKFLSGRGKVIAFAPHLLLAGAFNIVAVWGAVHFTDGQRALQWIAVAFSFSFLAVDIGWIARNTAQEIGIGLGRLFAIMALPIAVALLSALPGLLLKGDHWTLVSAGITLAVIGAAGLMTLLAMPRVVKVLAGAATAQRGTEGAQL
ncbi:MAG: hypothetical protein JY451_15015 [Erythrobacter sp.]|nr:MAG: hypothetical protein JY451_15015 [Erythrobacter sp.]